MTAAFSVRDLTVRYGSRAPALTDLSFDISRGSLFGIIGPNGSGKSTLIRALLGAVPAASGTVSYEDRPIAAWPRRQLARSVGAVAQIEHMPFPISVRELVAMGRYPHLGPLRAEEEQDKAAIESALVRCDIATLSDRSIATLSGGERQRARIARALAQNPHTLLLDEPTVALDVAHEMSIFELLRSLASEGWTVVVATHHLNLAARYSDRLLLLDRGRTAVLGAPESVMRKETIESVYQWPVRIYTHQGPGFDTGAPQLSPLSLTATESL